MVDYKRVVPNARVVNAKTKAKLLINLRPTHEAFTCYSFPSKNMEFMISGTPVLTTHLPGMPAEYHSFIYLFEGESVFDYARKITEVMSVSDEDPHQKGLLQSSLFLKIQMKQV